MSGITRAAVAGVDEAATRRRRSPAGRQIFTTDQRTDAQEIGASQVKDALGSASDDTGQLVDTGTGAHICADCFDSALDDLFELQDQVAASVAGAIEPKLR
jgi:hypothetical protein